MLKEFFVPRANSESPSERNVAIHVNDSTHHRMQPTEIHGRLSDLRKAFSEAAVIARKEIPTLTKKHEIFPADTDIEWIAPNLGGCSVVGLYMKEKNGSQHAIMTHNPYELDSTSLHELKSLLQDAARSSQAIEYVSYGICVHGKVTDAGELVAARPAFISEVEEEIRQAFPTASIDGRATVYDRYAPSSESDLSLGTGKKQRKSYANGSFFMKVKRGVTDFMYVSPGTRTQHSSTEGQS